MLITASVAAVAGLITVALVWAKKVGIGAALVVWLSGFTAASTGLAGPVNQLISAVVHTTH